MLIGTEDLKLCPRCVDGHRRLVDGDHDDRRSIDARGW
jgi:hypothetical protein